MLRRDLLKLGASACLAHSLGLRAGTRRLLPNPVAPARPPSYFGVFRQAAPTSTEPRGWMREMLLRQTAGLARHHQASGFPFDTCLWAGDMAVPIHGQPWWPYEQAGYLLDGLERLGLVTGDSGLLGEARANIGYVLAHQAADGSLGPAHIGDTNWPHAVFFRTLLAEYDATGRDEIASALERHYQSRPQNYGKGYRDCTNVEEMVHLYGVRGQNELLAIAQRTYAAFDQTDPTTGLKHLADDTAITEHGVTFNETAKLPAILFLATGDRAMLDASVHAYRKIDRDHMLPSGLHSAEERLRGNDPGLYHETCNVSDYTWSVGYLLMATGDAGWADRIEKAVFNAGLGSITKDFKAHQYFSSPNQVVARHGLVSSYNVNRVAYRPGHDTECCSGNVHRFLPNYVLRQWMRSPADGGIVAALYGASVHHTSVSGVPVTIEQQTDYPFSEEITLLVHCARPVRIPLHLRIPGWTTGAQITINGRRWPSGCQPATFETIQRTFSNGDIVRLHLPMPVRLRLGSSGSATVERGPLVFPLRITENATPVFGSKTTADFPAWDILPGSPWNYGLAVNETNTSSQIEAVERTRTGFPWDAGNSPIELRAPARLIPGWTLPEKTNPALPKNPQPAGDTQTVTLVPYGATRLRLTAFPLLT